MKIPFGRHKGQEVTTLPHDYLNWIRDNLSLRTELAEAVDKALGTEADSEHAAACREAIIELANQLTDQKAVRLYEYAVHLLSADRQNCEL